MTHALRPVASLLLGVSILLTGQGLQGMLLPVRATFEAFPTLAIGAIGASYFLGFTSGCLKGTELVRRVGHVRVFAAMTALASAVPLLHGLLLSPWVWAPLRFLTGFCFAVLYVVIESWLNEKATNENRGIIFSTYTMITLSVLAVGQMMMLLYDPRDMQLFAIASVLVSLAAIPVVLSKSATPEQPRSVRLDLRKLLRISPVGTLGCLATGLANGSFWALAPVYATRIADDIAVAAWFMTASVIGGAMSQWLLGAASDRFGRRKIIAATATVGALVALAIITRSADTPALQLVILSCAWGATAFPLYALAVAHTNDFAEPSDYVMVSSGLLLMYGAGAIVGPVVASTLMTLSPAKGLYGFTMIIHTVLAIYAVRRIFYRPSPDSEHHVDFGDALASAHTASQVYEEEIRQQAEADGETAE